MKKRKIYVGIVITCLLAILTWASIGMIGVRQEEKTYNVSIIVSDSNNDRWTAMREGFEHAAKDNGIQLNYVLTGTLSSLTEEKALVEREKENGADGIIIQLVSSENAYTVFEQIEGTTAVMLIETDAEPEGVYALTAPDNKNIGNLLASEVIGHYGRLIQNRKIGILSGNQEQNSMQQRLESVVDLLQDAGADIVWTLPDAKENLVVRLVEAQKTEPADIFISLGNIQTEAAVDYLLGGNAEEKRIRLYGVGCSEKAVYYLDKGIISTLIVPNEFNIGYQSMNAVAKQLRYKTNQTENIVVDSFVIDKENLYEEEKQKILFPIVQ